MKPHRSFPSARCKTRFVTSGRNCYFEVFALAYERACVAVFALSAFVAAGVVAQSSVKCSADETTYNLPCSKYSLKLADDVVEVKVYEKSPSGKSAKNDRTFVVTHNNEQKGLDAAKQMIAENHGRLVEVVSNYKDGFKLTQNEVNQKNFYRYLYFGEGRYCVDPNRIYTKVGVRGKLSLCETVPPEYVDEIYRFGQELLAIVTKNKTHRLIIGVHNNTTVPGALSVDTWHSGSEAPTAIGIYKSSDKLGSTKITDDEFVLVTNLSLYNQFFNWSTRTKTPCNIALQKDRADLIEGGLDDGSMSIYFGMTLFGSSGRPYSYINVEAGGKENAADNDNAKRWQKQMLKFALSITP